MVGKISLVLAGLLVGSAAFVLGAASASSGIAAPTEITVIEHDTTDKVVDIGKKGDSTGDVFTFHNAVYDETDTTKVGGDNGMCVRENPKKGTWECWWTTTLAEGQITVEGPYSDTAATSTFAVTGGTGLYENVRGTMLGTTNADGHFVSAFSLIP